MTTMPSISTAPSTKTHRVDRGAVGRVLVAATGPPRSGDRGGFSDANQLKRDIAVRSYGWSTSLA